MPYLPFPFELQTERLTLQLWEGADAAGYRQLVGERGDPVPTLEEAVAEIEGAQESAPGRGIHLLTLRLRMATGTPRRQGMPSSTRRGRLAALVSGQRSAPGMMRRSGCLRS